jgi:hypothetical protein
MVPPPEGHQEMNEMKPYDIVRMIREHDYRGDFTLTPHQASELVRLYTETIKTEAVAASLRHLVSL